jgi:hypothetical protein
MSDEAPCKLCGGKFDEHGPGLTQHVYTQREGEMKTFEQEAREKQAAQRPVMVLPPSTNSTQVERLVQVLLTRGLILTDDALYIAGMGPKPEQQSSGYIDPAQFFKSRGG